MDVEAVTAVNSAWLQAVDRRTGHAPTVSGAPLSEQTRWSGSRAGGAPLRSIFNPQRSTALIANLEQEQSANDQRSAVVRFACVFRFYRHEYVERTRRRYPGLTDLLPLVMAPDEYIRGTASGQLPNAVIPLFDRNMRWLHVVVGFPHRRQATLSEYGFVKRRRQTP